MKKTSLKVLIFLVCLFVILICNASNKEDNLNRDKFAQPVKSSRVHTWWHWVDGMISKEGITKDLESMKREGITQTTIFNLGFSQNAGRWPSRDFQVKKVEFVTNEWYGMFEWALKEAKRLGITIGVHNCDGWSESGGPWITPEMSMKKFVYTKTIMTPGSKGKIKLDKPFCNNGFYNDVAVVAYRSKGLKMNSFQAAHPEMILNKEQKIAPSTIFEMQKGDSIEFSFDSEFTTDKILFFQGLKGGISANTQNSSHQYSLMYSKDDRKNYTLVSQFNVPCSNDTITIKIPRAKARYFKLILNGHPNGSWTEDKYLLSHVELLGNNDEPGFAPEIPHVFEKTVSATILDMKRLEEKKNEAADHASAKNNEVVDLTNKMNQDGMIDIDLPDGYWTILRFGYTTTGVVNTPSTMEGRGLECDKMDTTALNLHFASFPQKLVEHSRGLTGSTFKFLLIDSWECNYQNWTARMPEEFEKRRGYKLIDWLPALCGDIVESRGLSDAFLYDFRRTIAEMIEENYYLHFTKLCHKNNLEMHAEAIYGGKTYLPLDVLKTNSYIDLPMTEFWTSEKDGFVTYSPLEINHLNTLASLSGLYNKPVLAAEAFTTLCRHSETPADLKLYGDRAYCSGINQMVLHSYVHQPTDQKPGMTLFCFGSQFNRNAPWWNYSAGWFDYQARIQYALQKGIIPADILYFVGDEWPQDLDTDLFRNIPKGIQANPCNFELLQKAVVNDGKITFPGGVAFSLLALPDIRFINYSTLTEVERLVRDGAVVYGEKPENMLSLKDKTERLKNFEVLTSELWRNYKSGESGKNQHGKGTVWWGASINDILKNLNVEPAFSTTLPDSLEVLSVHKTNGSEDIFFVVNQHNRPLNFECSFTVGDKSPEIWDPMTGECKDQLVYTQSNGKVGIPVHFEANESLFFVFNKKNRQSHISKVELDENQIFPARKEDVFSYVIPEVKNEKGRWSLVGHTGGNYQITTDSGEKMSFKSVSPEIYTIANFNGRIEFTPINRDTIEPVKISNLKSLTEFDSNKIKYFSGEARCIIDFDVSPEYFNSESPVYLDLNVFKTTGEVKLNDHFLRDIWTSDIRIPVNGLLKEHNHLEVTVATTNRNRLIGDIRETGHLNGIWTSHVGVKETSRLDISGLAGPLQLIKYSRGQ